MSALNPSGYSDLRGAIETSLTAIPDIGKVWDHWPYVTTTQDFTQAFVDTIDGQPQLRAWLPRLADSLIQPITHGVITNHQNWEIHGYQAISESGESEKGFLDLAQAVLLVLANKSTWGAIAGVRFTFEPQMSHDTRILGNTVCHHVEIRFTVQVDLGQYTGG